MFRLIVPIILIGLSMGLLFGFVSPILSEATDLKRDVDALNQALDNSKSLENERDKLVKKQNDMNFRNIERLEKMLPDNVDNIRLILEIEKIAFPYNMTLSDVKYSPTSDGEVEPSTSETRSGNSAGNVKEYGEWELEFATESTYANFLAFLRDLESNLRIVDITSISFSSVDSGPILRTSGSGSSTATYSDRDPNSYKYNFIIKTYWMKN